MDFSHPLGNSVKRARKRLGLTQMEAAEASSIDARTILNIENYRGNPKMEVLFPLIRGLQINAQEIFYPELERATPSIGQLRLLVESCTEREAAALIPVLQSVLTALRASDALEIP